jgi:ABC transport system ATP-binding/permease protein
VLVTHDRFLLDRVSTIVFGLDGFGGAERFADYFQWEEWKAQNERARAKNPPSGETNGSSPTRALATGPAADTSQASKKKLSFKETREFALMEKSIHEAEAHFQQKLSALHHPEISSDSNKLHAASLELEQAQKTVEGLYARWAELESKLL